MKLQKEIEDRLKKYKFNYKSWYQQNPTSESAYLLLLRIYELEWVLNKK